MFLQMVRIFANSVEKCKNGKQAIFSYEAY